MEISTGFSPWKADKIKGRSLNSSRIEIGQGLIAASVTFIHSNELIGFKCLMGLVVRCRIPPFVEASRK